MNIYLTKKMIATLRFILGEFISTHRDNREIYKDDLEVAQKLYHSIK